MNETIQNQILNLQLESEESLPPTTSRPPELHPSSDKPHLAHH